MRISDRSVNSAIVINQEVFRLDVDCNPFIYINEYSLRLAVQEERGPRKNKGQRRSPITRDAFRRVSLSGCIQRYGPIQKTRGDCRPDLLVSAIMPQCSGAMLPGPVPPQLLPVPRLDASNSSFGDLRRNCPRVPEPGNSCAPGLGVLPVTGTY